MSPAPKSPPSRLVAAYAALLAVLLLPLTVVVLAPERIKRSSLRGKATSEAAKHNLTVVSLAFGSGIHGMAPNLVHNCLKLRPSGFTFEVHTDAVDSPVCRHCTCVRFRPERCKCPDPSGHDCSLCEKLHFLVRQLDRLGELLFLDSDLIVLKDEFLTRLYPRTRVHDALGTYGHMSWNVSRYYGHFNTGLFFLRRLPGLDYTEMLRRMYREKKNGDQGTISLFVHQHYRNWDTLSLKWHCRFLRMEGYDIPPSECYTLHDRREGPGILRELNFTLLTAPTKA